MLGEEDEVMRLAEEGGEVGGGRVGKGFSFLLVAAPEMGKILFESGVAVRLQSSRQAAIDHVPA